MELRAKHSPNKDAHIYIKNLYDSIGEKISLPNTNPPFILMSKGLDRAIDGALGVKDR